MQRLLVGCVGLLIAACASVNEESSRLRLNGAEIERLIDTSYVEYSTGAISLPARAWREHYCNGEARSHSERVPLVAAPYAVVGDLLCVGRGSDQSCRAFYRGRDGRLYVQWSNSGNDASLEPIRVGRLPADACVN